MAARSREPPRPGRCTAVAKRRRKCESSRRCGGKGRVGHTKIVVQGATVQARARERRSRSGTADSEEANLMEPERKARRGGERHGGFY
jgi:hypothetical protein